MRKLFSYNIFVSCFLCQHTFSSVLVPFLHALISGLFRRILYSRRTVTFFLSFGNILFLYDLAWTEEAAGATVTSKNNPLFIFHMPRRDPSWKGQEKPQDREAHILIKKSLGNSSGCSDWILAEKLGHFFSYVIFILKSHGKIIKGRLVRNCILKYRVAIWNPIDSTPLLIVIHLLLYVRGFMRYKSHICL